MDRNVRERREGEEERKNSPSSSSNIRNLSRKSARSTLNDSDELGEIRSRLGKRLTSIVVEGRVGGSEVDFEGSVDGERKDAEDWDRSVVDDRGGVGGRFAVASESQ